MLVNGKARHFKKQFLGRMGQVIANNTYTFLTVWLYTTYMNKITQVEQIEIGHVSEMEKPEI